MTHTYVSVTLRNIKLTYLAPAHAELKHAHAYSKLDGHTWLSGGRALLCSGHDGMVSIADNETAVSLCVHYE